MSHPMRWVLAAALALILLGFFAGLAIAADSEWKRLQRAQATDFCATVKKPPPQLMEAINQSAQQDARTWGPVAEWMNRVVSKYKEAGCGEA